MAHSYPFNNIIIIIIVASVEKDEADQCSLFFVDFIKINSACAHCTTYDIVHLTNVLGFQRYGRFACSSYKDWSANITFFKIKIQGNSFPSNTSKNFTIFMHNKLNMYICTMLHNVNANSIIIIHTHFQ